MIFCKPHVHVLASFFHLSFKNMYSIYIYTRKMSVQYMYTCMQFYTFDTCKGMVEERFPSLSNSWKNGQLPLLREGRIEQFLQHDAELRPVSYYVQYLISIITQSLSCYSFIHSHTCTFNHSLTHSLIHSLIHSRTDSLRACNRAVTNFSVGTVSGGAAAVAAHPLDVIRTRFVGQGEPKVCRGIFYHLLH